MKLILICLSIPFCVTFADQTKLVDTKQGVVEGGLSSNGMYFEFLGIRYGIPVKFRAPTEPPSFSGVYKADHRAVLCPQFPTNDPLAAPSDNEDCLILNIYVPNTEINGTLPVLFFIHGGSFGIGSSSPIFYGPQYLSSHGVIIVTVNYRLNAYGFLNLGIREAPGNAGLKDIRAALRWVKENIHNFNGDPDNVSVFGEGSGGVAAIYLTMSKSTKGLFKRIISQSGSIFTPQSFDVDGLYTAAEVAKSLGVKSSDPEKLLELYTETPVYKVEEAISKRMHAKSVFVPTVEQVFDDEEPFLVDNPYTILESSQKHDSFNPVPLIIGSNTAEGLTSILEYFTITSQVDRILNGDYSALDQRSFTIPKDEKEEFRMALKDTYFANVTTEESVIGGIVNLNTDFSFVGPMALFAEMYANQSGLPVYQYIFNHIGYRNLGRLLTNSSLSATTNRDELYYLFELERLPLPLDHDDARMVTFMTMMWCNFAIFGSPTPDTESGEWLPHPHTLAISLEPEYVAPLTPDRAYYWRTLYLKNGAELGKK